MIRDYQQKVSSSRFCKSADHKPLVSKPITSLVVMLRSFPTNLNCVRLSINGFSIRKTFVHINDTYQSSLFSLFRSVEISFLSIIPAAFRASYCSILRCNILTSNMLINSAIVITIYNINSCRKNHDG